MRSVKVEEARKHLANAVRALIDGANGYGNLSGNELIACNWANMAKEQLEGKQVDHSFTGKYVIGSYVSPKIKVGGKTAAQQVRMDKAARRHAKHARRGNTVIY